MGTLEHLTVTPYGIDDIVLEITDPDTGTTVVATVPAVDLIRAAAEAAGLDTLINPMTCDDVEDYTTFSRRAIDKYVAEGTMPAPAARFGNTRIWENPEVHAWFLCHRRTFQQPRPKADVTVVAIAREAGVHPVTAGKALRHGEGCSPSTIERVRKAAAELGWQAA